MKKITGYFLKGLLIFVPVAVTLFIAGWVIRVIDGIMPFNIPGMGLVATIIIIVLTGFFASNYLGSRIFALIDRLFNKLPIIKLLYGALKDMIEALTGQKKTFESPVLVEVIENGPKVMGFITKESLDFLGIADHVAVYMPQSYNFAGQVLIFPSNRVTVLKIESSKAMAFIVSGGISGTNKQ